MDVIDELIACCEAWEPEVCVMGNVRAGEAAKALRGLRADLTMAGAFHKAAVAQRNSAWEEIEHLRAELADISQAAHSVLHVLDTRFDSPSLQGATDELRRAIARK